MLVLSDAQIERRVRLLASRSHEEAIGTLREIQAEERSAVERLVLVSAVIFEESARVIRLRNMPYPDYLQTDHWKTVRREALRLAYRRCRLCNSRLRLRVHHRTYERRGCERQEDLIVLCADCHSLFHEKLQLAREQEP